MFDHFRKKKKTQLSDLGEYFLSSFDIIIDIFNNKEDGIATQKLILPIALLSIFQTMREYFPNVPVCHDSIASLLIKSRSGADVNRVLLDLCFEHIKKKITSCSPDPRERAIVVGSLVMAPASLPKELPTPQHLGQDRQRLFMLYRQRIKEATGRDISSNEDDTTLCALVSSAFVYIINDNRKLPLRARLDDRSLTLFSIGIIATDIACQITRSNPFEQAVLVLAPLIFDLSASTKKPGALGEVMADAAVTATHMFNAFIQTAVGSAICEKIRLAFDAWLEHGSDEGIRIIKRQLPFITETLMSLEP
jgi:hypothetical protein